LTNLEHNELGLSLDTLCGEIEARVWTLIENYDEEHHEAPEQTPFEMLEHLMEQRLSNRRVWQKALSGLAGHR